MNEITNRPDERVQRTLIRMKELRQGQMDERVHVEEEYRRNVAAIRERFNEEKLAANRSVAELERQLAEARHMWHRLHDAEAEDIRSLTTEWERNNANLVKLIQSQTAMIEKLEE